MTNSDLNKFWSETTPLDRVDAVVLAGGQGVRVGGQEKALLSFQGQPLLQHILTRLRPQVSQVWLNVNRERERYQIFQCPQFSDVDSGFLGPMEGMRSAWETLTSDWIVFVPCDNPCLPKNLMVRFREVYQQTPAPILVVDDGQRLQPLYCLMHRSQYAALQEAVQKGHLSVRRWVLERPHQRVDFSDVGESFSNLNFLSDFESP